MKTKDVKPILKSYGWRVMRDEVGDEFAEFTLSDRTVSIGYIARQLIKEQLLNFSPSVTNDAFYKASAYIRGIKDGYSIISAWSGIEVRASEITEAHVRQLSDEAIAWAQAQDLEKGLSDLAALPTTCTGTRPILHLAALAVLGKIDQIRSYQASFEAGDRLGFVPYINKDFIDRAVKAAESQAK